MWPPIARMLDRLAIRSAQGAVLPSPDGNPHLEEAAELIRRPDFFAPSVAGAPVQLIGRDRFEFPSPITTGWLPNNTVRGRCELVGDRWRDHPSVILLHGWNAELQYEWCLPYWSQLLARAGLNAFRFELPYHASRRPNGTAAIRNFLSGNLLHVAGATHQALADVRALTGWLRGQGAQCIGVWGTSLGAWLAGLAVANQREIDAAVLLTPVVRMERALRELAFCEPIRDQLQHAHQHFAAFNLVAHRAPVPKKKILMVAPSFDLFAPGETIDELEQAWDPEVWRLPHGHISVLLSTRVMRRITDWLHVHLQSGSFDNTRPVS
jgi:dienelactone hydrolase